MLPVGKSIIIDAISEEEPVPHGHDLIVPLLGHKILMSQVAGPTLPESQKSQMAYEKEFEEFLWRLSLAQSPPRDNIQGTDMASHKGTDMASTQSIYYFVTYTQAPQFNLSPEEFIEVIRKLDTTRVAEFRFISKEGALEHHKDGRLHAHCIFQIDHCPKRGFKQFLLERYKCNGTQYGNIDAKRVNFKVNPNSLRDMRTYISKEEFLKIWV